MGKDRKPRQIMEPRLEDRGTRGRRRKVCNDCIEEIVRKNGTGATDLRKIAIGENGEYGSEQSLRCDA